MKYQWQFCTDEENPEGYYQKLVNMNLPEVLSLEEAADRLNELEQRLKKEDDVAEYLVTTIRQIYPLFETFGKKGLDTITTLEDRIKSAREYLSQGYTPTETGMALNMSLEDVLKVAEEQN